MKKMIFKRGFAGEINGNLSKLVNARQAISSNRTDLLWYALHSQDLSWEELEESIKKSSTKKIPDGYLLCVAESVTGKLYEIDTIEELHQKFK